MNEVFWYTKEPVAPPTKCLRTGLITDYNQYFSSVYAPVLTGYNQYFSSVYAPVSTGDDQYFSRVYAPVLTGYNQYLVVSTHLSQQETTNIVGVSNMTSILVFIYAIHPP